MQELKPTAQAATKPVATENIASFPNTGATQRINLNTDTASAAQRPVSSVPAKQSTSKGTTGQPVQNKKTK